MSLVGEILMRIQFKTWMMIKINLKIIFEWKSWMIKLNKLSEFKSLKDASKALNKSGAKLIALTSLFLLSSIFLPIKSFEVERFVSPLNKKKIV